MKPGAILMASGHGKRFGGDKLFFLRDGVPLVESAFLSVPQNVFSQVSVVARDARVLELANAYGFTPVFNDDLTDDVAITIRLGMASLPAGVPGCMFLVCDQPRLRPETVTRLAESFTAEPERIWSLGFGSRRGNPVIFPSSTFPELCSLPFDAGGRAVISRHWELLSVMEVDDPRELEDLDTPPA